MDFPSMDPKCIAGFFSGFYVLVTCMSSIHASNFKFRPNCGVTMSYMLCLGQYMTDEVEADRQRRIQHIQNLYAFELFQQHRFEESMKMFAKLGTGTFGIESWSSTTGNPQGSGQWCPQNAKTVHTITKPPPPPPFQVRVQYLEMLWGGITRFILLINLRSNQVNFGANYSEIYKLHSIVRSPWILHKNFVNLRCSS